MNKLNVKLILVFLFIYLFSGLVSCGKKNEQTEQNKDQGSVEYTSVDDNDVTEKPEDLYNVDYREFYKELEPHGEWIEVTGKDIGVDLKRGSSENGDKHRTISIWELFGVNEAYATGIDVDAFFIWKPSPDLAVTVGTSEPAATVGYVPYTNGSWVNTDAGWYFAAPTPYEEITSHYGRWVSSPTLGWVWMPGRVWSPAWVDWRENDTYIAWTPIPPDVYIVNNVIAPVPVIEDRFIVVEKRYFIEPEVYKYMYKEDKNKIMIKEWRRVDGVMVMNKTVINKGPDVTVIKQAAGKDIPTVKITRVSDASDYKVKSDEIRTYKPAFKKAKTKGDVKTAVVKPEKFKNFKDVKVESKSEKPGEKDLDKQKEEKGKDVKVPPQKETGKEKIKENKKLGDDRDMKDGGKNKGNDNKGKQDVDKGKQNNDKGKQNNDKGKQNNDKGGKDKGKGKK